MIRRPPRSTLDRSSAASDVYKRQPLKIPKATAISDYAIIVDANDNVAVVKNETFAGLAVILPDDTIVKLRDAVPPGHRFATRDIPSGQFVTQFGQPIGTSLGTVSYTHLRAHETGRNLVCRLLLEKKKWRR